MKKISLLLFGIALILTAKAQENNNNNNNGVGASKAVYAELGGSGLGFSANFDSRFNGHNGLGYRVGIGFLPVTSQKVFTFPIGINTLIGKGPNYLEAEVTVTPTTAKVTFRKRISSFFILPHIGYRYSKPAGGFNFRIYAGPLIIVSHVVPWGGLSFGYTLKNKS